MSIHGAIDKDEDEDDEDEDEDEDEDDEDDEETARGDDDTGENIQLVPSCRLASCSMRATLVADTFCANAASVMARSASI